MSIYTHYESERSKVQHLSSNGTAISLGALVKHSPGYHPDIERYVAESLKGRLYRVIAIEAVPSSFRERLGIERHRAANAEIASGKERWYAAVSLAAVLTNADGSLARIAKSPCEPFLERYLRSTVPAGILEVVEAGDGKVPVGDVDYSISPYEHLYPRYQRVDQTYEGYSNRPTALLALYLINDSTVRKLLRSSVTKKGRLTAEKLMQLSDRESWVFKAVPAEAYFTDPFPAFAPYRESVNFQEIADELTQMHRDGSL